MKDELLVPEIARLHAENYGVYGVRKMWKAMQRAGWSIGRDQTARLMKQAGIYGRRRGRTPMTTLRANVPDGRPDLVNRDFRECPIICVRGLGLQVVRESVGVCHG